MGAERFTPETKLFMGPWYRRSPYFEGTVAAGATAYDIYNHMLPPRLLRRPERGVRHLLSRRRRVGRRRRVDRRGERPGRRPAHRHAHVPRPHEVRGEAGQVHARDRAATAAS